MVKSKSLIGRYVSCGTEIGESGPTKVRIGVFETRSVEHRAPGIRG